eukprot:360973-Chlamydomonas_euryale.AAC.6
MLHMAPQLGQAERLWLTTLVLQGLSMYTETTDDLFSGRKAQYGGCIIPQRLGLQLACKPGNVQSTEMPFVQAQSRVCACTPDRCWSNRDWWRHSWKSALSLLVVPGASCLPADVACALCLRHFPPTAEAALRVAPTLHLRPMAHSRSEAAPMLHEPRPMHACAMRMHASHACGRLSCQLSLRAPARVDTTAAGGCVLVPVHVAAPAPNSAVPGMASHPDGRQAACGSRALPTYKEMLLPPARPWTRPPP